MSEKEDRWEVRPSVLVGLWTVDELRKIGDCVARQFVKRWEAERYAGLRGMGLVHSTAMEAIHTERVSRRLRKVNKGK